MSRTWADRNAHAFVVGHVAVHGSPMALARAGRLQDLVGMLCFFRVHAKER